MREGAGTSAVTQFWAELDGAWHERSTSAGDFFAAAVEEDAFGDIEALRAADDLAAGEELAFGDRPQKVELEGRSYDEKIFDERLHGKECRVVQRFEIDGSVNRASGVVEILAHGELNLRTSLFGDAKQRPKPFVDRGTVIHGDERFKVCAFHGVGCGLLRDLRGFGSLARGRSSSGPEMFLVLAKQKLVGHSCDVIAHDDVACFAAGGFFVRRGHGAGRIEIVDKKLFEATDGAVAVLGNGRVIVDVLEEKALQLRVALG